VFDPLLPFYPKPDGGVGVRAPYLLAVYRVVSSKGRRPELVHEPELPEVSGPREQDTILVRVYMELSQTYGPGWVTVGQALVTAGRLTPEAERLLDLLAALYPQRAPDSK